MGDAAVRMKVMPESMDVDLKKLAEEIKKVVPSFARLHAIQEMPIAFGLKALIVVTIMDDKGGRSPDEIEEAVSQVTRRGIGRGGRGRTPLNHSLYNWACRSVVDRRLRKAEATGSNPVKSIFVLRDFCELKNRAGFFASLSSST